MVDNDTFEEWIKSAHSYVADRFPDWHPEMIKGAASDFAWNHEGSEINEDMLEYALSIWFSGDNPYSPHAIYLEGYDYEEWFNRNP